MKSEKTTDELLAALPPVRELNEWLNSDDDEVELQDGDKWGCWRYQESNNTLQHKRTSAYEVDLDKCQTKAEVLDWIFHLSLKSLSAEDIGNLVAALEVILPDKIKWDI